jgi:hypothetical protein
VSRFSARFSCFAAKFSESFSTVLARLFDPELQVIEIAWKMEPHGGR